MKTTPNIDNAILKKASLQAPPMAPSLNLVRFAHNWNNGMLEYWARSEALGYIGIQ